MWIRYEKTSIIKTDIETNYEKYKIVLGKYSKKKANEVFNAIIDCLKKNINYYEMP